MTVKWRLLTTILASFLVIPLFHNCGQFSPATKLDKLGSIDGGDDDGDDGGISAACLNDMQPVFKQTYHNFFNTPSNMCSTCHTAGGLAAHAPFAQPSVPLALNVFVQRFDIKQAPERIFNKLKNGHFGPTFSNVEATLEDFKRSWNEGLQGSACIAGSLLTHGVSFNFFDPVIIGGEETTDVTVKVPLRPGNVWQTLTWKLSDVTNNFGLTDVEFSVEIRADPAPEIFIPTRYLARNLKVKTPSKNLYLKNIALLLNGKTYFTTTYTRVDKVVEANAGFQIVMQASDTFYVKDNGEKYRNDDAWTLEIEELREATEADMAL